MIKIVNGIEVEMTNDEASQWLESLHSPAYIPAVVTMAQARKALILGGVSISSVNAAIAAIPDATERQLAETDWEYSMTVRRDSALVASIAPALGLTDQQIDELFVLAATL